MQRSNRKAGKLPHAKQQRKPVAATLLVLIRLYQITFSFLLGRWCRHLPSCSNYAAEAIRLHGAWLGFLLGLFRVMRCHPWGTEGFDPVPRTVPTSPFAFRQLWMAGHKKKMAED
jgi:putative membrane protein insertion efficiency factor